MIANPFQIDHSLTTHNIAGLLLLFLFSMSEVQGQAVNVAELTLKVGGLSSEELYYGFAEGDELVFSFEEVNGRELKELEIKELPGHSKFMDYKVTEISNQKLSVHQTAVYQFRFYNSSLRRRVCKVGIQRIPKSEEFLNFNTQWKWQTIYDTTYVPYTEDSILRYDTLNIPYQKKEKLTDNLELITVLDNHSIEVHSKTYELSLTGSNYGKNSQETVKIDLPFATSNDLKKVENIDWYYGISVNQQMKLKLQQTKQNLMGIAGNAASYLYGPQMKIAFEALDDISNDHSDQSIYCALIPDFQNASLFKSGMKYNVYREENIVETSGIRRDFPLSGSVFIGLQNTNETQGVSVYISCYVRRRTQTFHYVTKIRRKTKPVYRTLHKQRMVITTRKIRINQD